MNTHQDSIIEELKIRISADLLHLDHRRQILVALDAYLRSSYGSPEEAQKAIDLYTTCRLHLFEVLK